MAIRGSDKKAQQADTAPRLKVTTEIQLQLAYQEGSLSLGRSYALYHQTASLADLERFSEEARYLFGDEEPSVTITDGSIRAGRVVGLSVAEES